MSKFDQNFLFCQQTNFLSVKHHQFYVISQNCLHPDLATVSFRAVRPLTVAKTNGSEALWRKSKMQYKSTKIYRKTVILRFHGFLGISWDILDIPDVPVSILAIKFDLKIFRKFEIFGKIVTKPLFFGEKSLKIFVTVTKCNGSEVYGSEVLV